MDYFHYTYQHNHIEFSSHVYKVSSYHYNWHDEVEVLVLLKGTMEMSCNAEVFKMDPMDTVIISPQVGHATLALEPDTMAIVVHVGRQYFTDFDKHFDSYRFVIHSTKESRDDRFFTQLRARIGAMMLTQCKEENPIQKLEMEQYFTALALSMYEEIWKKKEESILVRSKDSSSTTFDKMIAYIDDNYQHKIELEDIAKIGGYNVGYASQFFKRQMGVSFIEYLLRLRLREATVRLVNSDEPISRIANRVGFADIKAFNVAFKKQFHTTPSEYRSVAKDIGRQTKLHNWKEMVSVNSEDVVAILQFMSQEMNVCGDNERIKQQVDAETKLLKLQKELEKLLCSIT